jgi:two-component SAPR family response regulator
VKKFEIVLIDDDMIFLMLQRRILISIGVKKPVISFSSPQEAKNYLQNADTETLFLIFLDINLSNTTAWDFLKTLEEIQLDSKVSVIITSSSVDKNDSKIAKEFSCVVGFIEKPLSKEAIENIRAKNIELNQFFF